MYVINRTFFPNSLDVEDGVLGVHGSLVLSGLTDETLLVGERDKGGGSVTTLVVGDWISCSQYNCYQASKLS